MDADQLRVFEEEIGMLPDPGKEAKEALRAYQQAQGMVFENPDAPVAANAADGPDLEMPWLGGSRG